MTRATYILAALAAVNLAGLLGLAGYVAQDRLQRDEEAALQRKLDYTGAQVEFCGTGDITDYCLDPSKLDGQLRALGYRKGSSASGPALPHPSTVGGPSPDQMRRDAEQDYQTEMRLLDLEQQISQR